MRCWCPAHARSGCSCDKAGKGSRAAGVGPCCHWLLINTNISSGPMQDVDSQGGFYPCGLAPSLHPCLQRSESYLFAILRARAGESWGTGAPFTGSVQPMLWPPSHAVRQEGCSTLLGVVVPHTVRTAPNLLPCHLELHVAFISGADTPHCCSWAFMGGS